MIRETTDLVMRYGIYDKHLLLDTGVLKNIFHIKAPEREKSFWLSLHKRNYFNKIDPFFLSTTLMGIEVLGFEIAQLDPYVIDPHFKQAVDGELKKISAETIHDGLGKIGEHFYLWLKVRQELALPEMKARLEREMAFRSPKSRDIVNMLMADRLISNERHGRFLRDLAYDRIQALPYHDVLDDPELVKKIDVAFLTAALIDLAGDRSIASTRMTDAVLARAAKTLGQSNSIQNSYGSNRDALDTEIVQFACCGHWQPQEKKLNAVVILSTERLDKWPPRIQRCIGAIRYLNEAKARSGDPLVIRPGLIFQVDAKSGEVMKTVIDVYNDFEMEGLICEQDLAWKR